MRLFSYVLALTLCTTLAAQQPPEDNREEVLSRIINALDKDQSNLHYNLTQEHVYRTKAPAGLEAFFLGDSNPDLRRYQRSMALYSRNTALAESKYRQTLTAEVIAATRGLSRADADAYLSQRAHETFLARQRTMSNARAQLADRMTRAKTAEEKAKARAYVEGSLRERQLEEEVYQTALRRHRGQDDQTRMKQLLQRLSTRKTTLRPSDIADSDERKREEFLRKSLTEMDIAEYRRLARTGTLIDTTTGIPEAGESRLAMARDAERALAIRLEQNALKPSRYDILAFTLSKDEREIRAKNIEEDIKNTPEYVALDMLSAKDHGNQGMRFLALSQALRKQQEGVADWRAKFVKGTDTGFSVIDGPTAMLRTGAADYSRIWDNAGEMSLSRVDARINNYNTHVDKLSGALAEAGQLQVEARRAGKAVDLSKLSPATRRVLEEAKYLTGQPGSQRLTINDQSRALSGLKGGLNLPGDHPLNAISGQNLLEMAATTYIPAAASGRVAQLLEGLKVSRAGVAAATFGTDLATGMVLTGITDYAKHGKLDPAKIAIESTLLQSSLGGVGKVTNGLSGALAKQIAKNPSVRSAAEATLRTSLGLASETTLQSYYQAKLQGSDMTYDMFLANLMNGALSRKISHSVQTGTKLPDADAFLKALPQRLRKRTVDAHEVVARSKQVAETRMRDVLGDGLIGKAGEGTGLKLSPGMRGEMLVRKLDDALSSGRITWSELKMLYGDNPGIKPVLKAVNEHRAEYFQSLVGTAQRNARNELDAEFAWRRKQAEKTHADNPEALARARRQLQAEYQAERDLIDTNPRAPGSGNLTSDVDRSIASERVRKQLKQLYRKDRDGHDTPATSAKSYDVNEYIDVFPVINKILPRAKELAGVDVTQGDFAGLKHAQAVEAQGMATAMLHMNDAQRRQFRQNVIQKAGDPELARKQLAAAGKSLNRADRDLEIEMQRVAAENPNLRLDPADLALRARDNLYGRRTEAIRKSSNELLHVENDIAALRKNGAKADDPELQKLLARKDQLQAGMQRDWGIALREGIETYGSFTGLDAIVSDGQIAGIPIRDLITDPKYVRIKPGQSREHLPKDAKVKELSDGQVDSFMRDQIMMMTHHVNGLHGGHEDVVSAASALGKYGERAVLALKFQGKDLNTPPYRELSEWSEKMVANRKDPAKLKEVLRELSKARGGNGSEKHGLLEFVKMAGTALPGAEGIWDAKKMGLQPHAPRPAGAKPTARELKATLANRRRMLEHEEEQLRTLGPLSAAQSNRDKQDALQDELATLERRKARRAKLGENYLAEDWNEAEALEATERELLRRKELAENLRGPLKSDDPILKKLATTRQGLAKLRKKFQDKGGKPDTAKTKEDQRIERRIAAIQEELAVRKKAEERYKELATAKEERIAAAPALPEEHSGEIRSLPAAPAGAEPGSVTVTVTLDGVTITVPVTDPR